MMSAPIPPRDHRLAAIWCADLVGYPYLSSADGTTALRLVELLRRSAREVIERHHGQLIEPSGDAVLAEFGGTDAAIRAALDLQAEFATRSSTAGRVAWLRVGVHVGDVVTTASHCLGGEGINTAAHLQAHAPPGGVAVSEDVWRELRQRPEFRFRSLGEPRLRDGEAPLRIFSVTLARTAEGQRALGPPRRPAEFDPLRHWLLVALVLLAALIAGLVLYV
jgi:adenylate cyclase